MFLFNQSHGESLVGFGKNNKFMFRNDVGIGIRGGSGKEIGSNIQLHSETYPYNRWVPFSANSAYEGGSVRLVLNIPAGGSIDTNGFNFFDGYKNNITNITC